MANFRDLSSLFKYLEDNVIRDVMAEEVHDTVAMTMSEKVESEVYDAYSPYVYQRRGSWGGGLADTRNVVGSFHSASNGLEYLVQNITRTEDGEYLSGLIEYGHNNGYGSYDYPYNRDGTQDDFLKPRRFIHETYEALKRNLDHVHAMRSGLERRGIKTE